MPVSSPMKLLKDLFSFKSKSSNNGLVSGHKKSKSCVDISEPINVNHLLHIETRSVDDILHKLSDNREKRGVSMLEAYNQNNKSNEKWDQIY